MKIHYRERVDAPRKCVSFKLTKEQIDFLDNALNDNETRSDFIERCVLARARYRNKIKRYNSKNSHIS